MVKRILFFGYGVFCYVIFLGTFLYAIGFIGNFGVPTTLDGPATGPFAISLAIDAGLLTLFAVLAIRFEDRDLVREFGDTYEDYRRRVPMLVPSFRNRGAEKESNHPQITQIQ